MVSILFPLMIANLCLYQVAGLPSNDGPRYVDIHSLKEKYPIGITAPSGGCVVVAFITDLPGDKLQYFEISDRTHSAPFCEGEYEGQAQATGERLSEVAWFDDQACLGAKPGNIPLAEAGGEFKGIWVVHG
jgi:hypothetical protein